MAKTLLVRALAARDGPAVLAAVDGLREAGQSASSTLEQMAVLLQQMAVEQAVPGSLPPDDPDAAAARVLACLDRPDFGEPPIGDVRELA